ARRFSSNDRRISPWQRNRPCCTTSRSLSLYGFTGETKPMGGLALIKTASNASPARPTEYFLNASLVGPLGKSASIAAFAVGFEDNAQTAAVLLGSREARRRSSAKKAATKGEYVQSNSRVGAP